MRNLAGLFVYPLILYALTVSRTGAQSDDLETLLLDVLVAVEEQNLELLPNPGELITGFNFTDLLNVAGKALNQPDVRGALAGICQDTEVVQAALEIDTTELCSYLIGVADDDGSVEGLLDICQEDEEFDMATWFSTYGGIDFSEDRKRRGSGDVSQVRKRRSNHEEDLQHLDDLAYLEALLMASLSDAFGEVPCDGIVGFMRDDDTSAQEVFQGVLYGATDIILHTGLPHCFTDGNFTTGNEEDDFDAALVGALIQAILGHDSIDDVCEELYDVTTVGELTDHRKLIVNSTLDMLTDKDYCVSNFDTANVTSGEVLYYIFGTTNYTYLCDVLVNAFTDPADDVLLKLDYFWFYEREDTFWSYSAEESIYDSGFWGDEVLDWLFAWDLLTPHLTPPSFVAVIGKMYNADNAKSAFIDFCNALPPALYVWQMEEMCDAIIENEDYGSWRRQCIQIGSQTVGYQDIDVAEDWLEWNRSHTFDWTDEWYNWYATYHDGWRFDHSYDGDVSWVLLESILEEYGVNDKNESETCRIISNSIDQDSRPMNETIYDILLGWGDRAIRLVESWCDRSERLEFEDDIDWEKTEWHDLTIANFLQVAVSTIRGETSVLDACHDIEMHQENGTFDSFIESFVNSTLDLVTDDDICVSHLTVTLTNHPGALGAIFGSEDPDYICGILVGAFTAPDDGVVLEFDFFWYTDDYDSVSMLNYQDFWPADHSDINWIVVFDFLKPHITPESWIALIGKIYNAGNVSEAFSDVCSALPDELNVFEMNDMCSAANSSTWIGSCEDLSTGWYKADIWEEVGLLKLFPWEPIAEAIASALFGDDLSLDAYDSPCVMIDTIVNGDTAPLDLAFEVIEVALARAMPWLSRVCEKKDFFIEHLFGDESSNIVDESSDGDGISFADLDIGELIGLVNATNGTGFDLDIIYEDLDGLVSLVTGKIGIDGACTDIASAVEGGTTADLAAEFVESGYTFLTTVGRCRTLAEYVSSRINELLPESYDEEASEFIEEFSYITGYTTIDSFCEDFVVAMTQAEIEECEGVEDCAGICNGDAELDCANVCNGGAANDCAGECNGGASINFCDECVGGRTGRPDDFGMDQCGICKKNSDYTETWDCAGTCNGTAFRDRCGECVGGTTGYPEDENDWQLDCRGICNGGWLTDSCGFCEPFNIVIISGGSLYEDCSGTCVTPGNEKATLNDCGDCIGGSTGVEDSDSYNVCGQCLNDPEANATSCEGCDGVPNSGKVFDTCGVCGGSGTDCVGVGSLEPDYIPDKAVLVTVTGAGFLEGADLSCIFYDTDLVETETPAVERLSNTEMTCEAELTAGEYTVGVRRDSDNPNNIRGTLKVYTDPTVTSLSPSEMDIDPADDEQTCEVVVAVSGTPFTAMESETDYTVTPSIIVLDADGEVVEIVDGSFSSGSELAADVPVPRVSGEYTLVPSVNGEHLLGTRNFTVTVYYPAPSMTGVKFADNGASLVVDFDRAVEFSTLTGCDDIFDDVSPLGASSECSPSGTITLIVLFGRYNDTALFIPGDTITLKDNSVKSLNQLYSRTGTGSQTIAAADSPPEVTLSLTGPETIPSCGFVNLDARKSTGSGGRPLMFKWEVGSSADIPIELEDILNELNDLNSGNGVDALSFNGSVLLADTQFTFYVGSANFLGDVDSGTITVTRSGVAAPEVKAVVEGADPEAAFIADSFYITAEVKYYSECVPAGETEFEWSCSNTDVPLNLKTQFTRRLYVPANTLPGGEVLEFTVRVFKADDPDAYVESSVLVTTVKSDLIAVIDGGKEFTIGRDSGDVIISAANSIDPDDEAREWEYSWECVQITDEIACWSFDPDNIGYQIVNETNFADAEIVFDALSFEADKEYEFMVTVRKEEREASTSVLIFAVNGNPPKITLVSSDEDGVINDDENIVFTATISHQSDIAAVMWETADVDDGYGYIDFDDDANLLIPPSILPVDDSTTVASIGINRGIVSRGTGYAVTISVTTVDDQTSSAKVYITVRSGPTSCEFTVDDYEELNEVVFLTENCVASADAAPLNFQLFVVKENGAYEAITEKKADPSITGIGKPKLDGISSRTYIMTVCDKYSVCSDYEASPTVSEKSSFSDEEIAAFKAANVEGKVFAGDTLGALTNRNMLPDSTDGSRRRRRAAEETSELATEQLELIQLTLDNNVLDSSSASALIDQIDNMNAQDMTLVDQSSLLDVLSTIVDIYLDEGSAISEGAAGIVLAKCAEISEFLDTLNGGIILDKITALTSSVSESLASDLSVGAPAIEIASNDKSVSTKKAVLSGAFQSTTASGYISVDFGSELATMYGAAWSCGMETCSGVTLAITHYGTDYDFFSTDASDVTEYRMTDIITIDISNPNRGEVLSATGLTSPVTIDFPVTRDVGRVTAVCMFWDEDAGEWSSDGVTVVTESDSEVTCQSTHLTSFTVVGEPVPTTTTTTTEAPTTTEETEVDPVDPLGIAAVWIILMVLAFVLILFVLVIVLIYVILKFFGRSNKTAPEPTDTDRQNLIPMQRVQQSPANQTGYKQIDGRGGYPASPPGYDQP